MSARLIDVSAHQGVIDWRAVAASGVVGAYLRALEGKDEDPTWHRNRREALDAGLWVGSYAYLRARHPGRWQAELLLGLLGDLGPRELPPCVDVETLDGQGRGPTQTCLLAWLDRMRTAGLDPLVYTYPAFWAADLAGGALSELAGLDLWIADYRQRPAPEVPRPWRSAVLWQTSGEGSCPGVTGKVDLNTWLGPLTFEAWAGRRC